MFPLHSPTGAMTILFWPHCLSAAVSVFGVEGRDSLAVGQAETARTTSAIQKAAVAIPLGNTPYLRMAQAARPAMNVPYRPTSHFTQNGGKAKEKGTRERRNR